MKEVCRFKETKPCTDRHCEKCELCSLFDINRQRLMKCWPRYLTPDEGEYRMAIHLWLRNNQGEYLIQQRSGLVVKNPWKFSPLTGVVLAGEDSRTTVLRELEEEMGIVEDEITNLHQVLLVPASEFLTEVWLCNYNGQPTKLQKEEVVHAIWMSEETVRHLLRNQEFVPATQDGFTYLPH